MAYIDKHLEEYIRKCFPKRKVNAKYKYRTRQTSRYLYVTTFLSDDESLHYEYIQGRVELHLEGKYQSSDYREFAKQLRIATSRNTELTWGKWNNLSQGRCTLNCVVDDWQDLRNAFQRIMDLIDPIIKSIDTNKIVNRLTEAYSGNQAFDESGLDKGKVCLNTCPLGQLFSNPLIIPEYQRNYCWERAQVDNLLKSLTEIPSNGKFHLGTIIIQKDSDGNYSIIDGQQRLVTLSLICRELGYCGDLPLLKQTFRSESSKKHVAYNLYQIRQYCSRLHDEKLCYKMINNLVFSTLILTDSCLDLAYTFFSNENSKGVPLTDYDLLKAHHLRFVYNEGQAEHLAQKWDRIISQEYRQLDGTLSVHLFRLRKWMRKSDYDSEKKFRTKEEFSAALTIPNIPPFGEQFVFYDKIQGGPHFFAYTEQFVDKYIRFEDARHVKLLRKHLCQESHWRYEDIIETLLFGYYLKFGIQYLTEALFCIASNIAQHRYTSYRAMQYKIREFAKNSEIIMMIDQASSPTFFLAECLANIKYWGKDIEEQDIQLRFYQRLQDLFAELRDDFTDNYIIEKYNNEYE